MLSIALKPEHDPVRNMAAMHGRPGSTMAPAAWPVGVSLLAQVIASCQRCEAGEVCSDWLTRAPKAIDVPPEFCPNAPEFKRVKKARGRS